MNNAPANPIGIQLRELQNQLERVAQIEINGNSETIRTTIAKVRQRIFTLITWQEKWFHAKNQTTAVNYALALGKYDATLSEMDPLIPSLSNMTYYGKVVEVYNEGCRLGSACWISELNATS